MQTETFIDLIKASRALSIFSFCVSLFLLSVWLFAPAWHELNTLFMKCNTSVALTAAGIALFFKSTRYFREHKGVRAMVLVLGLLVWLIGATTLLQYWAGLDFGIDEIIVSDFRNPESILHPGRMSPIAAFGILLLGASILFLFFRNAAAVAVHQIISLLLIFLGTFALVGYLIGVDALYKVGPFIRISPVTAACLVILALAGLCLRSNFGIMQLITARTPGGMAIRRLLPTAIFFPPLIGWLRLQGQTAGMYDLHQGTSFSVITYMVIFSFLIYRSGRALNLAYEDRARAEKRFVENLESHSRQLENAVRTRDEFLSIASHELKTPLTSLMLQMQMQKRIFTKENIVLPPKTKNFFENADRQVNRLARLIEDMLDIGRIESGKFNLRIEEFDLAALVKEVCEQMAGESHAANTSFALHLPEKLLVKADRIRVAQVLINLLSNSCKYGQGKPISIFVDENLETKRVSISVKDGGQGIAPKDQARIFERFERAVPGSHVSGLGLGLYIVKSILEQHRGNISVKSTPGEGAEFIVDLPLEVNLANA